MPEPKYLIKFDECPGVCPKCGTPDIKSTTMEGGSTLSVDWRCGYFACGFEWVEHYIFHAWEPKDLTQ